MDLFNREEAQTSSFLTILEDPLDGKELDGP